MQGSAAGGISYRFTLLRHAVPQYGYYWLLRTPLDAKEGLTEFSGVLLNDLVADTSPFINETRQYIRVDFQRDSEQSQLCTDQYEMCSDSIMHVRQLYTIQCCCICTHCL